MLSEEFRDVFLYGSHRSCPIFPTTYFLCLAQGRNEVREKRRKRELGRRKNVVSSKMVSWWEKTSSFLLRLSS